MIPGFLKFGFLRKNGALHRLVRDGGLEIYTPDITEEAKAGTVHFKSLVQPDGDIITYVYNELPNGKLWQTHHQKLNAFAEELASFRRFIGKLSYAGPVIGFSIAGMLGWSELSGWLQNQVYWLIFGAVTSLPACFLKRMVMWWVRRQGM